MVLTVAGGVALFLLAGVVVSLFAIPIDMSDYKGLVESTASKALGRTVTVDGSIIVTTSLWPAFEMQGMRISNPGGFETGDLAKMDLVRTRVGLIPLLSRKIHIKEFRVQGFALNLERNANDEVNWILATGEEVSPPPEPAAEEQPVARSHDRGEVDADLFVMDRLVFQDISVSYRKPEADPLKFVMKDCKGSAGEGDPLQVSMQGVVLDQAFDLDVQASSLAEFLAMTGSSLDVELQMAGTTFQFGGSAEFLGGTHSAVELSASMEGESLDSLDDLLGMDLPPLKSYRLGADLRLERGRIELSELEIRVGESALMGTGSIDRTGPRPQASLDLTAEMVQLDDFDTGDWSPEGGAEAAGAAEEVEEAQSEEAPDEAETERESLTAEQVEQAKLMSQEVLRRADARLTVQVQQVLAGDDDLGSGEMTFQLADGRLSLDPVELAVPGGEFLLRASLKPGATASDASLRVLMKNFDFGVLMRRSRPDTDLGGTINLDWDVQSSAAGVKDLLASANGYIDVSGNPENLKAGIVDLWAVNLVAAVASSATEKEEDASQINCVMSRWTVEDGLLSVDQMAIDTSKIRICGKGTIDLDKETFDLVVGPTAKRPEFFSLATPLKVQGDFDDIRIGLKKLGLTKTAFKFLVSPLTTPTKRLVKENLPEDGSDICELPIGPREGELKKLPGC
jgi:uncharacterized protein involved in outer membrane biogenesis